ncbi:MAG: NAD(P)-binding domain-containing protein, partial [Bacteroidales bacterium]|nr:NAD(P)-binding domain-containing protein [Bacteroidales bacterium]
MEDDIKNLFAFGMIGLGTMGSNLLQNVADHGFSCAGYDINLAQVTALNELNRKEIRGFSDLKEF